MMLVKYYTFRSGTVAQSEQLLALQKVPGATSSTSRQKRQVGGDVTLPLSGYTFKSQVQDAIQRNYKTSQGDIRNFDNNL